MAEYMPANLSCWACWPISKQPTQPLLSATNQCSRRQFRAAPRACGVVLPTATSYHGSRTRAGFSGGKGERTLAPRSLLLLLPPLYHYYYYYS